MKWLNKFIVKIKEYINSLIDSLTKCDCYEDYHSYNESYNNYVKEFNNYKNNYTYEYVSTTFYFDLSLLLNKYHLPSNLINTILNKNYKIYVNKNYSKKEIINNNYGYSKIKKTIINSDFYLLRSELYDILITNQKIKISKSNINEKDYVIIYFNQCFELDFDIFFYKNDKLLNKYKFTFSAINFNIKEKEIIKIKEILNNFFH